MILFRIEQDTLKRTLLFSIKRFSDSLVMSGRKLNNDQILSMIPFNMDKVKSDFKINYLLVASLDLSK